MAELFTDLLDDAFNRGGLAHVAAQHGNAVPELTCDRLQPVRILPDDYNGRTFLPEQLRSFKSDAGSSAGNEDDFVRQFHDLLLVRKFLVRSRVLRTNKRSPPSGQGRHFLSIPGASYLGPAGLFRVGAPSSHPTRAHDRPHKVNFRPPFKDEASV